MLSAMPFAIFPIVAAVQGAMSMASAQRPRSTCEFHVPSLCEKNSLTTGLWVRAERRDGSDELLAGRCDDNLYLGSSLDEASYDEARFIGSYRACDAQYYFLSFKTHFSDLNI